ncbi:MAG TPA: lysyl oxidase family protein [Thermoanaerobaculia bacterium]|nr:lysyl oxidase family protein [Thermoanaerobaculia bacterium]
METRRFLAASCLALGTLAALGAGAPVRAQGLPDMIVDTVTLQQNWLVRDENLPADACSVIEGGVTPGVHRIIRFTVTTPNVGTADVYVGNPADHIAANDGLFEFATCHQHYHFRNYAKYELIDPQTGQVWKAAKRGFCMLDTDPVPASVDGTAPRSAQYKSCGNLTLPGNQGISHGWSDTYKFYLGGQYFVLDGGDNQPVVPPGDYILRITANPPFKGDRNNPCRALDTATGLCHNFAESDYTNNIGEILITIPDHPGRSGYGPLAGAKVINPEPPEH